MSAGVDVPLEEARLAAEELVALLAPGCDRIEVAGSVRRRKVLVHDIEVVAIPKIAQLPVGLLVEETVAVSLLEERLEAEMALPFELMRRQVENHRKDGSVDVQEKDGPKFKALVYQGIPVDLFVTDAERWGCIYALRTGPGDWNVRLVMECKRVNRTVADGRVLHMGKLVATPEEADFFRELGQPWIDPWDRHVDRIAIRWPVSA